MTESAKDLPEEVRSWLGQKRYEQEGEFDVERGYIFTSCSTVQNGNPLFWEEKVADEITGGFIAPLTMISVWGRPHYWSPGRTEEAKAMQVHFDLKQALELPEAIIADNSITFGEPVRIGDRLHIFQVLQSVSELKTTRLGTGRFWTLEVVYENQKGDWVATESFTGFGYRRD